MIVRTAATGQVGCATEVRTQGERIVAANDDLSIQETIPWTEPGRAQFTVMGEVTARGTTCRNFQSLIRSAYSQVRVSTLIRSPVLMNRGTRIFTPGSTVASFNALVAVLPFTPGSV